MSETRPELTPSQRDKLARLAALPDELIDTTDIPEIADWSRARRGMFVNAPLRRDNPPEQPRAKQPED